MKHNDKLTKLLNQKLEISDLIGEPQCFEKTYGNINYDNSIKVVHLCSQDFGGAGKAAYRLHKGLQSIGVDSTMLVLNKRSGDPSVKVLPTDYSGGIVTCSDIPNYDSPIYMQQWRRWYTLLSNYPKRPAGLEMFTDGTSDIRLDLIQEIQEADIINLHWVAGSVDCPSAPMAIGGKPIIWTLHDMNSFTGGCHYAGDCRKYIEGCGACPQLGSDTEHDLSHHVWKQKYDAYNALNINIVTPSRWLGKCASESKLFSRFPVTVIPYGFPVDIFKPYPKEEVRKALNIPESANVILFGADSVVNERKGFKYLLIADESQLAMVYSAADVFVLPSLEDNLPNTVVEAMACGVPVVGFDIGGIPDMIEHKKTGYLVKHRDIAGLIEGIEWLISSYDSDANFSKQCREKVDKEYALEVQAKAYKDLYKRIFQDHLSWVEDTQAKARELNQQGEDLFSKDNIEGALNAFTRAIEINPNFATAHNNLGVLYLQTGEAQKAVDHFAKALEIDPDDRDTILNCGELFKSLEKFEDAKAIYSSYLQKSPNDEEITKALADIG
jgi:glycosyltransferase involved in cell wall biosynthesis